MSADTKCDVACGMAIAAGIVCSAYGEPGIAAEILRAGGLDSVAAMRKLGVETYDIRLCIPALKEIRDERQPRRADIRALKTDGGER